MDLLRRLADNEWWVSAPMISVALLSAVAGARRRWSLATGLVAAGFMLSGLAHLAFTLVATSAAGDAPGDTGARAWAAGLWLHRAEGDLAAASLVAVPSVVAGARSLAEVRAFHPSLRHVGVAVAALTPLLWRTPPCCTELHNAPARVLIWMAFGALAIGVRSRASFAPCFWLASLVAVERAQLVLASHFSIDCFTGGTDSNPATLTRGINSIYAAQLPELLLLLVSFTAGALAVRDGRRSTDVMLASMAAWLLATHPAWAVRALSAEQ